MFEIQRYKTTVFGFSWWTAKIFIYDNDLGTVFALSSDAVFRKAKKVCVKWEARVLRMRVRDVKKFQWTVEKLEGK